MIRPKYIQNTPPETNMSPENQWLEDAFPIWNNPFLGDEFVSFRGVSYPTKSFPWFWTCFFWVQSREPHKKSFGITLW